MAWHGASAGLGAGGCWRLRFFPVYYDTYSYLEWAEVLIEFHGPQIFIMSFYLTLAEAFMAAAAGF